MATHGEFTPTDDQKRIALAAAEARERWTGPHDFRVRFILPGQPAAHVTWRPNLSDEDMSSAAIKTGLCWIEDYPFGFLGGVTWALRVQANGDDYLVRNGRFFQVSPTDPAAPRPRAAARS